ncbi:hypothetical protein [Methylobacterium iners]|uniref:hypothetical protein n=1 Tax=Methylobacterium iners TaxID=418707 RepID=UPI001EE16C24|nr:hypothetical protein [Methylobacterium iners]
MIAVSVGPLLGRIGRREMVDEAQACPQIDGVAVHEGLGLLTCFDIITSQDPNG